CPSNTTYKNSGCPWHGPIDEILDHLDTCSNIPPEDLLTMTHHARSEDAKIIKTLARQVAKLESIIEKIPKQSMVSTEHSRNSSASMSPEIQQRLAVLEQRNARNSRIIASLENEIAALRLGNGNLAALPATTRTHSASFLRYIPSTDGTLSWKIEGFSQKMHEAKSYVEKKQLQSPIFYTHNGGYKLCTKVYLNGEGRGHKTHVSLFLTILKGENDIKLTWPFSHIVTFKIINQRDPKDNVTDSFRPDPTSNSFHKPIKDANIASGCPLFLAQSRLDEGFTLNDTMYIETIVKKR
ncbi:MATH domain-containing protein, partial [Endozoicomonas sp. ONNA2]|uniref:MATH domain-containing protein n=1 Tax=Endozoicomonas sp. ONNA2 TaxID=2828741 RepID=UPI00214968F0